MNITFRLYLDFHVAKPIPVLICSILHSHIHYICQNENEMKMHKCSKNILQYDLQKFADKENICLLTLAMLMFVHINHSFYTRTQLTEFV